jgi:hypothetical protein
MSLTSVPNDSGALEPVVTLARVIAEGGRLVRLPPHAEGLHDDSGHECELTNVAAEFRQHELRVRFVLKKRADVASTCMVGTTADVVSMTKL